jgi:hypothetical protein
MKTHDVIQTFSQLIRAKMKLIQSFFKLIRVFFSLIHTFSNKWKLVIRFKKKMS